MSNYKSLTVDEGMLAIYVYDGRSGGLLYSALAGTSGGWVINQGPSERPVSTRYDRKDVIKWIESLSNNITWE